MNLPESYIEIRESIRTEEITYGVGGIKLFATAELEQGQVGYAVASDGKSLYSDNNGSWRSGWIVIGYETACGDPLFIDSDDPALPVLTAMHGVGNWEPSPVAISLKVFARSLEYFAQVSKGRSNPVELENNPLSDDERNMFLQRIAELNEGKFEPGFWSVLLEG